MRRLLVGSSKRQYSAATYRPSKRVLLHCATSRYGRVMGEKRPSADGLASKLNSMIAGTYIPSPPPKIDLEKITLYGGLEGVDLSDRVVLTDGLELRPTYAHCFSHFMAAFGRPPSPTAIHPAPWLALRGGGVSFDVGAEIRLDASCSFNGISRIETLNLLVALIRLLSSVSPRMPMVSDTSFSEVSTAQVEPSVFAWETLPLGQRSVVTIDSHFAEGLKTCLPRASRLLAAPEFRRSFKLFDAVTWLPTSAARLTAIWTAIETAMRPGRRNTSRQLARSLGDLLGANRPQRDRICNKVLGLYAERGGSAHDSQTPDFRTIRDSYMLARSMFIRIIADEQMPQPPTGEGARR